MTEAHGIGFVAGNLGLVPHTMRLERDGTAAQMRRALRNCEAVRIPTHTRRSCVRPRGARKCALQVLHGMDFGSAASVLQLLVYASPEADVRVVEAEVHDWIRRRARPNDASASLPLLILVVDALPMGALVEAQIEAAEPGSAPLAQFAWEQRAHGLLLSCTTAIGGTGPCVTGSTAAADVPSALGMLQCIVAAAGDAGSVSLEQVGAALRDAFSAARQRLPENAQVRRAGGACYARCFRAARSVGWHVRADH